MARCRRILFLDAHDSFTNNIVALLETLLDVDVFVLEIDDPTLQPSSPGFEDAFRRELARYDAVVCGPGPGSPDQEADVGLMSRVWQLEGEDLVPVLGVCLGFQSLVLSFGATIRRLRRGLHGMVREIVHRGAESISSEADIFAGVGPFKATLYHSLCADIDQDAIAEATWDDACWEARPAVPDVVPLAWTLEDREDGARERILMAARHREKPFWGLQYHPESVCTDAAGHQVIRNWFRESLRWSKSRGRVTVDEAGPLLARNATRPSILSRVKRHRAAGRQRSGRSAADVPWTENETGLATVALGCGYHSATIALPPNIAVPDIVEILEGWDGERIVLDSANADAASGPAPGVGAKDVRGRFSIIALGVEEAVRIEHQAGKPFATARLRAFNGMPVEHAETIPLTDYHKDIWQLLADFHARRRIGVSGSGDASDEVPFRGGFMGFVTYEMGLDGIGISAPEDRGHARPDLSLAWVTKSIVVDHARGTARVQCLQRRRSKAEAWIWGVADALQSSHLWRHGCRPGASLGGGQGPKAGRPGLAVGAGRVPAEVKITAPDPRVYEDKVRKCQEFIAAGESYELCLTDQTTITRRRRRSSACASSQPSYVLGGQPLALGRDQKSTTTPGATSARGARLPTPWQLYRALRTRQPAPFASFLRLGAATLISGSPERFLDYSTDVGGGGGLVCTMKPMKGTVRKSEAVPTLAEAERLLHVPKEEAENLMIVDLVRHDLHGVCGAGNVVVRDLMRVEEHASVFQMITAVEGRLPPPPPRTLKKQKTGREDDAAEAPRTGFDVLAASLPPGSMTGAPKKRSCEILLEIEGGTERSLYSGVVGYMDVTGRGDWSVTIRSLFRWDDNGDGRGCSSEAPEVAGGEAAEESETWHIGAGGAVTILSTPEGECEEMMTKLAGPLGIFGDP